MKSKGNNTNVLCSRGVNHLFAFVVKWFLLMYGTFVFLLDSCFLSQLDNNKKKKVTEQIANSKCLLHI